MTDPRWLDEQEQRAWRSYLDMHARLATRLHQQLQADSALSLPDFEVLVQLTDQAEPRMRIGELADALQWEKSRLSHHLARMQRRGLVLREECADDARGTIIVLTTEGREAIEKAAPAHVNTVRELVFDQLTPEQITAMHEISRAVLTRLGDEP